MKTSLPGTPLNGGPKAQGDNMPYEELYSGIENVLHGIHEILSNQAKKEYLGICERLLFTQIGAPSVWGKQAPADGFDCSGFIVWFLRQVGVISLQADYKADTLFSMYPKVTRPNTGCLVYYGKTNVSHVMYCLNQSLCLGANGAGPEIKTISDALRTGARVEVRAIKYRADIKGFNYPFDGIL